MQEGGEKAEKRKRKGEEGMKQEETEGGKRKGKGKGGERGER